MPWDIILGGVTGLIGNIITAWSNFKTQKLKNEHDEAMYSFKIQELGAKTDAAIKITEAKISGAVELADSEAYKASQTEGNKQSFSDSWIDKLFSVEGWLSYIATPVAVLLAMLLGSVDVLKGIMRPGLTLYLTAVTTWLTWTAYGILQQVGANMTSQQALDIYNQVTSIVIYLTVSCVTWWFGDRRIAKFLMRLDDGNIKGKQVVNKPKGQLPK
jgi:hypothetical protein